MTAMDFGAARRRMVNRDLVERGIGDLRVLMAMAAVPRERFLEPSQAAFAYDDGPLPIGDGQTISQPYVVARVVEALALAPADRVLEIGTGSGYAAAVLAEIAAEVYTVERIAALANRARCRLADLGYARVRVLASDGTLGWPEHAPYDAIVATAGGLTVPSPLLDQLAIGGRLLMPVGSLLHEQRLVRVVLAGPGDYHREELDAVAFIPLIGAQGWPEPQAGP